MYVYRFYSVSHSVQFIYFLFLYDEGPMLETLDYTIRIGSTPTFLYFDLYEKFMTELIHIKAYRDSARIK